MGLSSLKYAYYPLRKKCLYSEFFWSAFLPQKCEKNVVQSNSKYGLFYAVIVISKELNAFGQQLLNKKQTVKEMYLGPYQTSKVLCNY